MCYLLFGLSILAIEGLDLTRASSVEILSQLRQVFDFLPKETRIDVADGIVTIDIPDSPNQAKSEAPVARVDTMIGTGVAGKPDHLSKRDRLQRRAGRLLPVDQ